MGRNYKLICLIAILVVSLAFMAGCGLFHAKDPAPEKSEDPVEEIEETDEEDIEVPEAPDEVKISLDEIPEFDGEAFVEVNGNVPEFDEEELGIYEGEDPESAVYEVFMDIDGFDELGRTRAVTACIGKDMMPGGERESIGMVKPSGWQISKYDFIDDKYLYNRCHLAGWQLSGYDGEDNLITGTRYMNVAGMLPFENKVADYIRTTGNHVYYRVEPVYDGEDLLARGVHMEAYSLEDSGEGISFNVFCYNVQPGVKIDYATGANEYDKESFDKWGHVYETGEASYGGPGAAAGVAGEAANAAASSSGTGNGNSEKRKYVLNTNTFRFHYPECKSVQDMKDKNKKVFKGTREQAIKQGYKPCGNCNP